MAKTKDYRYNISESTFYGNHNIHTYKKTPWMRNSEVANIFNNGLLPPTKNIELPPFNALVLPEREIVSKDNWKKILKELSDYHKAHPNFGLAFDFEIWQSYNIPQYVIKYLFQQINETLPTVNVERDPYDLRPYETAVRENNKVILKTLMAQGVNINDYIIKKPNYFYDKNDMVILKVPFLALQIVNQVYNYQIPKDNLELINTLFKEGYNLATDDWFDKWIINHNIVLNFQELSKLTPVPLSQLAFVNHNYSELFNDYLTNTQAIVVEFGAPKDKITHFINRVNLVRTKDNKLPDFEPNELVSIENAKQKEQIIKTFDAMINDKNSFSNFFKDINENLVAYPFYMVSFTTPHKTYTFIENQAINNGYTDENVNYTDYLNKADASALLPHFIWILIAKGIQIYGVNSGDYDLGLVYCILLNIDPYFFNARYFSKDNLLQTTQKGGAIDLTWTYMRKNINSYWRNAAELNQMFPFIKSYKHLTRALPLVNGLEIRHTDTLKESIGGAVDEDKGKGLKEVEANYHSAVETNKGLDFNTTLLPNQLDKELFEKTITYNNYDTWNTLSTYANIYAKNQQSAKNSIINTLGQGANLFRLKDLNVNALLKGKVDSKVWDWDTRLDNQLFQLTLGKIIKPIDDLANKSLDLLKQRKQNILDNYELLGINYWLANYIDWKLGDNSKLNDVKSELSLAMQGVIYRLYYWGVLKPTERPIYPEFALLNKAHSYKDLYDWVIPLNEVENSNEDNGLSKEEQTVLYKELTKNDRVDLIAGKNENGTTEAIGIEWNNASMNHIISKISYELALGAKNNNELTVLWQTILSMYVKYQQSDLAVLAEQGKLKLKSILEGGSNAGMVKAVGTNMIYLSYQNRSWKPNTQLENNEPDKFSKLTDTDNPMFERVNWAFKAIDKEKSELIPVENIAVKDPNNADFMNFHFETPVDLSVNSDFQNIAEAIKFHNKPIYRQKLLSVSDKERINAANYYNQQVENNVTDPVNYNSFSRLWYNNVIKDTLTLIKHNLEYKIPLKALLDKNNYTVKAVSYGTGLNEEYYPAVYFNYLGNSWEITGLSLDWVYDKNKDITTLTNADLKLPKIKDIAPFEVKYWEKSVDTENAKKAVRYEFGLIFHDDNGNEYQFRLDRLQPSQLQEQSFRFYKNEDLKNSFDSSLLYAVDWTTNLDLANTKHDWNWKRGTNPVLMQAYTNWYETHKEHVPQKGKYVFNNGYAVEITNPWTREVVEKHKDEYTDYQYNFFMNESLISYIKAGGIHGASITKFNELSGIYAIDIDQRSFYPWIEASFVNIGNFNELLMNVVYDMNVQAKILGRVEERFGLKLCANTRTGIDGEEKSPLSNLLNSTNMLRTGELQNLQMHAFFAVLAYIFEIPFVLGNDNTDGNFYTTSYKGAKKLNEITETLYTDKFNEDKVAELDKESGGRLGKLIDLKKLKQWHETRNPYGFLWENVIEVGTIFMASFQTSVNRYIGLITNFKSQEKDKKKNKALYEFYEKYCGIDPKDTGNEVRFKVFQYYINHRGELPPDFNYDIIRQNVKIKGAYSCWDIILDNEQGKKEGKPRINAEYQKFGKGPIIDFAVVEKLMFRQNARHSLVRFDDILNFCFNAKRSSKYDGSYFENLNGERTELDKINRYIIVKSKDKSKVGNINKYKVNTKQNFDLDDVVVFLSDNKIIYNRQNALQRFALKLNESFEALGLAPVVEFNKIGVARNGGDIDVLNFNVDLFKQQMVDYDNLRKSKKGSGLLTSYSIYQKLSEINEVSIDEIKNNDKILKETFSQVLSYDKTTNTYNVVISKDEVSKVVGSFNAIDTPDKDGYYTGNYLLDKELVNYSFNKETGEIIKDNTPTGLFIDLDAYYHMVLNQLWTNQRYFLIANKPDKWFMNPEEVYDYITQSDIKPNITGLKNEISDYLHANGIDFDWNSLNNKQFKTDSEDYVDNVNSLGEFDEDTEELNEELEVSDVVVKPTKIEKKRVKVSAKETTDFLSKVLEHTVSMRAEKTVNHDNEEEKIRRNKL